MPHRPVEEALFRAMAVGCLAICARLEASMAGREWPGRGWAAVENMRFGGAWDWGMACREGLESVLLGGWGAGAWMCGVWLRGRSGAGLVWWLSACWGGLGAGVMLGAWWLSSCSGSGQLLAAPHCRNRPPRRGERAIATVRGSKRGRAAGGGWRGALRGGGASNTAGSWVPGHGFWLWVVWFGGGLCDGPSWLASGLWCRHGLCSYLLTNLDSAPLRWQSIVVSFWLDIFSKREHLRYSPRPMG